MASLPLIGGFVRRLQYWRRQFREGRLRGRATAPIVVADYLPSGHPGWQPPSSVRVAVVIPVYRGLEETRRCIESVLVQSGGLPVEVIVVNDCSPDPELSRWLRRVADTGALTLLRNESNRGFVTSVNRGMAQAGDRDVILLNSDTEVPARWIERLAGHAYSAPDIGTVTPFSNNATICSWPSVAGGPLPPNMSVDEIDAAFLDANRGRQVGLPTAVGFCMYIRRDCLGRVGAFDEATFGRGYGEENDFCMRATAAGWRHLLACDTFVSHVGEASFGKDSPERTRAWSLLTARYPTYAAAVARHVEADTAAPARFAATAALFRRSALPTILAVTHALGGGTDRHVRDVQAAAARRANFLRIEPHAGGLALSVPGLSGHPVAVFPADRLDGLVALLKSCGVKRVHVHHLVGLEESIRSLLDQLGLPFDLTIHDYFAICPQINLLPTPSAPYCGEPDAATCNACIARRPQYGATDITEWRSRHAWLLQEAERLICPSADARNRIARYAPHARVMAVPHEAVPPSDWHVRVTAPARGEPLRIGMLGIIAPHKGLNALIAALEAAGPEELEVVVIGYCVPELPSHLRRRVRQTGPYDSADIPRLLAEAKLHVAWFPATWPETYSYTLSEAIAAALPIVAPALGAFPERLMGRPLTWLVEPTWDGAKLRATFAEVRSALGSRVVAAAVPRAADPVSFYPDAYLKPIGSRPGAFRSGPISLHRPRTTSVLVLPDRFPSGGITPCGYIRLVQPFDAMAAIHRDGLVQVVDVEAALHRTADALVCQRHVVSDLTAADRLIDHCRRHGMRLIYDLDDDLLSIPMTHPEADRLSALSPICTRFITAADSVWAATPELRERLSRIRPDVELVRNAHDERIWRRARPRNMAAGHDPVRILYMGTATHDEELAFMEPIAESLHRRFGRRVRFDVVGVAHRERLPRRFRRVVPDRGAARAAYPAFVEWLCRQEWDLAVSPLIDSPFNRCKSAIKLLDYAALGLPVIASAHAEYDATFGVGTGVQLVANSPEAWVEALSRLIVDPEARRREGAQILRHYRDHHVLCRHPDHIWAPLRRTVSRTSPGRPAPAA